MKKNRLKISVESDFNAKIVSDKIKKLTKKNNLNNIKNNNFENININLNGEIMSNDFVFIISQIDKTFKSFTNSILRNTITDNLKKR